MKFRVPDRHMDAAGIQPLPPQPCGHGIRQKGNARPDLCPCGKIFREGKPIANGFYRLRREPWAHRGSIETVGVIGELRSQLSHQQFQCIPVIGG